MKSDDEVTMGKRKTFEWILKIILAAVFCISAYTKLIKPGIIEIILVDHGIVAARETAAIYVRFIIGLEFALGLLFLQPYFLKKFVVPASLIFLISFTIYLGYTGFILNDFSNCGCFGEIIEMSPVESIIKNVFLLGLVALLFKLIRDEKKKYWIPVVIIILGILSVFVLSPIKKLNEFKFGSYTYFTGWGRVDLSSGDKLLAVFNTECDHCQELAKELTRIKSKKNFPEMFVLFFTEGAISVDSFKTLTKSNFPYRMINTKEFFDLIGQSPPRIYWLRDGLIKTTWDKDFKRDIIKSFSIGE